MINFWKLSYEAVKKQRDQYKQENEKLEDEVTQLGTKNEALRWRIESYKDENERLEHESEKLKRENRRKHYSASENNKYYKELWNRTEEYRVENGKLRKLKDIKEKALKGANFIIKNQKETIKRLEKENSQQVETTSLYKKAYEKAHKGWFNYKDLTNHIRLKASANPGEHRYIALVNFIDRLEKGEN